MYALLLYLHLGVESLNHKGGHMLNFIGNKISNVVIPTYTALALYEFLTTLGIFNLCNFSHSGNQEEPKWNWHQMYSKSFSLHISLSFRGFSTIRKNKQTNPKAQTILAERKTPSFPLSVCSNLTSSVRLTNNSHLIQHQNLSPVHNIPDSFYHALLFTFLPLTTS